MKIEITKSKSKAKNTKPIQVSKSLYLAVWVQGLAAIITIFSLIMCAVTGDTSVLCFLIPAAFTDASAVTALMLWKRKSESMVAILTEDKMKKYVEWLVGQGVEPSDFFRAFKE